MTQHRSVILAAVALAVVIGPASPLTFGPTPAAHAHRHRLVHAGRVVVLPHVVEPSRRSSMPPTHSAQSMTPRSAAGRISRRAG